MDRGATVNGVEKELDMTEGLSMQAHNIHIHQGQIKKSKSIIDPKSLSIILPKKSLYK